MSAFFPLAALAAAAQAALPAPGRDAGVQPMERIVVTAVASRVPEALVATPATVSVIDRGALEDGLARDIAAALRYEPGVSVERSPARFGLGEIAIRGLEGNRVTLMLDGVRVPDGFRIGSFSNATRTPYDVALLQRIEILRGPASALYGSDALAGVVSMTTLDPRDVAGGRETGGRVEAGYDEADGSFVRSGAAALRRGGVELLAAVTRSDGTERDNRGDADLVGPDRTAPNPQDARARARLAKAIAGLAGGGRVRLTWEDFERRVATDALSLNPQSPRTVSLAGDDRAWRRRLSLDGEHFDVGPLDSLRWIAYRQRSRTEQDTTEVRAGTTARCLSAPGSVTCRREARFVFEQDEVGVTAIAERRAGRHRVVAGAEWARTDTEELRDGRQTDLATGAVSNVVGVDVFPTRDFPISRAERFGAFVQDEIDAGFATFIPALRYDRFEMRPRADAVYAAGNPGREPVGASDHAVSPKLGVLVPLGQRLTLAIQAAAGFRAPPYYDVNVSLPSLPLGYTVIPNPELEPEESRGLEVSLRGRHGRLDGSVTAFRTDYDNLIVSRAPLACPGDPRCVPGSPITFQSQNVTEARIRGLEARLAARLGGGWSARAGAAWARGDDLTRGAPLNTVDPAKLVVGLAWEGGLAGRRAGAELHVTHVARKKRIDQGAGPFFATPAFTTADLTTRVELARGVTLRAGVFNVFDAKHWRWSDVRRVPDPGASVDRYTQPGRTVAVALEARF